MKTPIKAFLIASALALSLSAYAEDGENPSQDKTIKPQTEIATRSTPEGTGGGGGFGRGGFSSMTGISRGGNIGGGGGGGGGGRTAGNTLSHPEAGRVVADNATRIETTANIDKTYRRATSLDKHERDRKEKESKDKEDKGRSLGEKIRDFFNRRGG